MLGLILKSKDITLLISGYLQAKFIFLAVLIVLFLNVGIGQNTIPPQHKRDILTKGQKYTENFSYSIRGKDTIPQGLYELSKISSTDSTKSVFSIIAQGIMKNGSPHDFWQIRSGHYSPDEAIKLNDFQLTYSIKGDEIAANGHYDSGNKSGLWRIHELSILNGHIKDTLFSIEVNYENNVFDNKISIRKNGQVLEGAVNSQKYLEGLWQHKLSNPQYEVWEFKDGFMSSIEIHEPKGKKSYDFTKHLISVKYSFETHKFNAQFLRLYSDILERNYPEIAMDDITFFSKNILLDFPEKLAPVNHVFGLLKDNSVPVDFLVRLPIITLEEKDSIDIRSLSQQVTKTQLILEEIQNNIQIKALSEKVAKLNEYNIIINKLTQNYLDPIIGILEDFDNDVLKYSFTPAYLKQIYQSKDTLHYEFLGMAQKYPLRYKFPEDSHVTIDTLIKVMEMLEKEYYSLKNDIIVTIESLEKKESLVALESALVKDYEVIMDRVSKINGDALNEIAGFYVYEEIKNFVEKALSEYLSTEDEDKKLEKIQILLECVEDIGFLINRLESIPQDFETIDRLYINTVFNPYTFTNMDERINPGIYNAFQYTLLPALLGKIKSLEYTNVSSHRREYDILLQGMVDLLKTNNKKVERYVKRTRDPQKIVNLLGIKIEY